MIQSWFLRNLRPYLLLCILGFSFSCKHAGENESGAKMGAFQWPDGKTERYTQEYYGKLSLVPEYDPAEYVVIDDGLNFYGLIQPYVQFIQDAGAKPILLAQTYQPTADNIQQVTGYGNDIWTRDFLARTARRTDTGQPVFVKLKYYTILTTDHEVPAERDEPAFEALTQHPAFKDLFQVAYTPIRSEWGNLSSTRRNVFAVLKSGQEVHDNSFDNTVANNAEWNAWFLQELKGLSGLEPVLLDTLHPYDGTGHTDMFMMPLSDNVILMSTIDERYINLIPQTDTLVRNMLTRIASILKKNAETVMALGYQVHLVPAFIKYEPYNDRGHAYRSFTNALIVNSHSKKSIMFPKYYHLGYEFLPETNQQVRALVDEAEANLRIFAEAQGYSVSFVRGDDLAAQMGVVHCTAMQIPYYSPL